MKIRLSPREKDFLWHSGKTLLCALQLWFLNSAARMSCAVLVSYLLQELLIRDKHAPLIALLHPIATAILFVVLWRYYDSIDDRSFNRFCDAPETPRLLREPCFRVGMILTVLTASPILTMALYPPLKQLGLGSALGMGLSILLAVGFTLGYTILRLRDLEYTWTIQKNLRTGREKTKLVRRILYAVIFFAALLLLAVAGLSLLPVGVSLFQAFFMVLFSSVGIVVLAIAVIIGGISLIRNFNSRCKFMKRLARLRERGELSYTIHGHPFLSVLFNRVFFGLTITDAPHPDGKKKGDTTYIVGFISTGHRKGTIILCDNHVYRFMYAMRMRGIGGIRGGGNLIYGAQFVSVPAGAWYTNHGFRFPDGEGERILVLDPTPRVLALHGRRADELITLDNASKVFDYTVYGKNSFLNMLERT